MSLRLLVAAAATLAILTGYMAAAAAHTITAQITTQR